jgi:hypothetical protein
MKESGLERDDWTKVEFRAMGIRQLNFVMVKDKNNIGIWGGNMLETCK